MQKTSLVVKSIFKDSFPFKVILEKEKLHNFLDKEKKWKTATILLDYQAQIFLPNNLEQEISNINKKYSKWDKLKIILRDDLIKFLVSLPFYIIYSKYLPNFLPIWGEYQNNNKNLTIILYLHNIATQSLWYTKTSNNPSLGKFKETYKHNLAFALSHEIAHAVENPLWEKRQQKINNFIKVFILPIFVIFLIRGAIWKPIRLKDFSLIKIYFGAFLTALILFIFFSKFIYNFLIIPEKKANQKATEESSQWKNEISLEFEDN